MSFRKIEYENLRENKIEAFHSAKVRPGSTLACYKI